MATRTVTDCDRCGKEGIEDSFRLEVEVDGEKRRVDLDTKCLGAELKALLDKQPDTVRSVFYNGIVNRGKRAKKDGELAESAA